MPGAARVGDPTVHGGTVVGPGVATVLVGGMPAAVLGDMHACPIPPPSHLPSTPFVAGSATVMISGRPALRASDACACGASVAVGCPTVVIA
ncbi:PAAR domain-containing protein [Cellulomonas sp. Root137]|uniref:PAAR domain-containing protein n=1 Tax=Cellulomonas sp. Root137 TaxID=1736459 RepID=UPI0007003744|nr:PAAR domain-containing protein [Cellulomonas sp. Root137]KQY42955.1 PaaR repeat-containing protein [Cellulomonas sp. Root137]KRD42946.1 PaaR repeat-containing protein [Cellulomonas sp. Root930]